MSTLNQKLGQLSKRVRRLQAPPRLAPAEGPPPVQRTVPDGEIERLLLIWSSRQAVLRAQHAIADAQARALLLHTIAMAKAQARAEETAMTACEAEADLLTADIR